MPHRQQQQSAAYSGSPRRSPGSTPHSPTMTTSAPPPTPNIQVSSSISSFAMMCPPEAMAAVAAVEASQSADIVSRREADRAKRERYFKKLSDLMHEQRLIEHELECMDHDGLPPPLDLPPSEQPHHYVTTGPITTTAHHPSHHHDHSPLRDHADSVLKRLGASLHHQDASAPLSRDTGNRTANRFVYQTVDNSNYCEMTAEMEHSIEELVGQIVQSSPLIRPSSLPSSGAHISTINSPSTHPLPPAAIGASSNIFDVLMSVSGATNNENGNQSTELVLHSSVTAAGLPHASVVAEEGKGTPPGDEHHQAVAITTTTTTTTTPASQQPPRPFPYRAVSVLAVVMFNESLAFTMSIPFIGLFVAHLQGISPDDAGYTSGFLVGSFMFGQVISGKYWGQFSDSYGRKPAMMTGLFLGGVFVTLFGLSSSIFMAMIVRLMHGICFGNCLVAKAMIAEVIEEKDQAIGFSIVSITWSSGTMLGPAIGGFLYNPTRYFDPDTSVPLMGSDSIFASHPALFPSALCALYSFIAFILVELLLNETNEFAKPLPTVTEITRHVSGKAKRTWNKKAKYVSSLSPTASVLRGGNGGATTTTSHNTSAVASPTSTTTNNRTATFSKRNASTVLRSRDSINDLDVGGDDQFTNYPEITEADADNKNNGTHTTAVLMGSSAPSNSRRVEHGVNRWVEDQVSPSLLPTVVATLPRVNTTKASRPAPPPASSRGTNIHTARTESDTVTFIDEDRLGGSDNGTAPPPPHHDGDDDNDNSSTTKPTTPVVATGFGYMDAFRNPATRMAIILYMIICFCEIAFLEILPLWAVASLSSGGLALQSDDVAIIVGLSSISGLIANVVFPKIIQRLKGPLSLFPLAVCLWAIPSLLLPSLTRYLNVYSSSSGEGGGVDGLDFEQQQQQTSSTFWMIATVVIITIPRSFGEGWGFSIVFIMTARAAPPGAMGAMTGIAQSLGAALRCIAPLISAPLFAWSISSPGRKFPFDESFAFLVASIPMFCCIPVGRALDTYLDSRPPVVASLDCILGDDNDGTSPIALKSSTTPSKVGKSDATTNIDKHALIEANKDSKMADAALVESSTCNQRYGVEDSRMEEDLLQPLPSHKAGEPANNTTTTTFMPVTQHIPMTPTTTTIHPPGEVVIDQLTT